MISIAFTIFSVLVAALFIYLLVPVFKKNKATGIIWLVVLSAVWMVFEIARPHVTYETITGTEVRRIDEDGLGPLPSVDVQFIYTADQAFQNMDSWWWLKKNSDNLYRDAKTIEGTDQPMWIVYNGARSTPLSWWGNIIGMGTSFPMFTAVRMFVFYLIALFVIGGIGTLVRRTTR